jgi:hypothetical protein
MRILVSAFLFTALAGAVDGGGVTPPQLDSPSQQTLDSPSPTSTITVPTGTKIVLALISPLWAKSAKPGDSIYSSTAFPVAVNNEIAIPPGTYVQGEIDTMTRPGWRSSRAVFQMHFTKLVFANGYTVALPSALPASPGSDVQRASTKGSALPEVPTAIATVYVEVSSRSDILLDNGSQIEMVLQGPLSLEADRVAAAARQSKRLPVLPVKSATQCRPVPGTPGTSDTAPGTYVEGALERVIKRDSTGHPRLQIHFSRIVFTNGYAVALDGAMAQARVGGSVADSAEIPTAESQSETGGGLGGGLGFQQPPGPTPPPLPPLPGPRIGTVLGITAGVAAVGIVSAILLHRHRGEDVLFDSGWQFEMVLESPLSLDADRVAAALAESGTK